MSIFINIHTHSVTTDISLYSYDIGRPNVAAPVEGTRFSAGVHPWSAEGADILQAFEYLSTAPLMAIGEIGLDYSSQVDRQKQKQIFEAQLEIAEKRGLPVIMHCVKAYYDILPMLAKYELRAVIFHGYIGSPEQTATIYDAGYYFSFGERSLRSPKTMETLRIIPHDRIFAETDDSNVPISDIYAALATQLNMTVEELKIRIEQNYKHIFE